ncbi:MAG: tRNA (adenosine(37)-N6)-threonylcarbamoyltransferase complex dimerization subunit type 1 TsaB [Bacteroidota bacterium]|nr:tRNA (adenosine(37)-N6)-threonylcarbamoyltransferase complex dimerization subunit type 1 TsaB [Bacteroidota bacterium]
MPVILNIETSAQMCSVSLSADGNLIGYKESTENNTHASLLGLYIDGLLKENNLEAIKLDAVAVSKGPGSYTGLRIGVSTAKGLCYGAGIPLIGISTLECMAYSVAHEDMFKSGADQNAWLCPMIDARRMEVYTAFFNTDAERMTETHADIITPESYKELLDRRPVYFFGSGAVKCQKSIVHPHAFFSINREPSAKDMIPLSESAFRMKKFEDVAYFEPFYLKDFVATTPKKSILTL